MIVVDTNLVSEPLKPRPEPRIAQWIDLQSPETLFFTATSYSEVLAGLEKMPDCKRKANFREKSSDLVFRYFGDRILPFDRKAAEEYARIVGLTRRSGVTLPVADAQIAAIAAAHNFSVATRDVRPFEAAGIPVINPWTAAL